MRAALLMALALAGTTLVVMPASAVEQMIQPLTPPDEQRVETLGGGADQQQVQQVGAAEAQAVMVQEPPSPGQKTANVVGKVVLSVASAALALGFTVASLLFF